MERKREREGGRKTKWEKLRERKREREREIERIYREEKNKVGLEKQIGTYV